MKALLEQADFTKFQPVKQRLIDKVDQFLTVDIGNSNDHQSNFWLFLMIFSIIISARIMDMIPAENAKLKTQEVHGGAFDGVEATPNPFEYGKGEGIDVGRQESVWIVGKDRWKWDEMFQTLLPIDGKITGESIFHTLLKSLRRLKFVRFGLRVTGKISYDQVQTAQPYTGKNMEVVRYR